MKATVITDSNGECRIPGAVKFWQALDGFTPGMTFRCPCCGRVHGSIDFGSDGWDWNQDIVSTSVAPSIRLQAPDSRGQMVVHFSGYLRNGEWVAC